jgi:hypothetical protein
LLFCELVTIQFFDTNHDAAPAHSAHVHPNITCVLACILFSSRVALSTPFAGAASRLDYTFPRRLSAHHY